jgi:putative membrane protein
MSFAGVITAADLLSDDQNFLEHAAEGNDAEIALANLALKKTSRPGLKAFARRIVTDHKKANGRLKAIAADNDVQMPTGTSPKHKAKEARLAMLEGRDFEDDYVNTMIDDHQADIKAYQKELQYGADADLKKFASLTIPLLRQHLSMAKTIQGKMAASE